MYRPKETKDIYADSLSINSRTLEKQLTDRTVPPAEIKTILSDVSSRYGQRLAGIVEECQQDMMALERVPSPLRLFIDCLSESAGSLKLSDPSRRLIERYVLAWEEWM